MSGKIYTEFYCDECQCVNGHLEGHAIKSLRQEAQDCDGWIYVVSKEGRKDICPDCQKEEAQSEG